jgi:hypothetical protein
MLLVTAIAIVVAPVYGEDLKISEHFKLDGIRYIKTLHKDVNVPMFWNNGVRGKGLLLSFFGKLDSKVLNAYNLNVDEVVLADNTSLASSNIRTKTLHSSSRKETLGISLGSDQQSVGIHVDLDMDKMTDFKRISGTFTVDHPTGSEVLTSHLLEDKKGSADKDLGISVEICSNWGFDRYFLFKIPNAEKIKSVTILDEKGSELKQVLPFNVISSENLKVYVKKSKGTPFSLTIDMAKAIERVSVSFTIQNIALSKSLFGQ